LIVLDKVNFKTSDFLKLLLIICFVKQATLIPKHLWFQNKTIF